MEAGLEHLRRGTAKNVDLMLIIVEPYYRSLEAGARTADLAAELDIPHIYAVANKVRSSDDQAAIEGFCAKHGMRLLGAVPLDETFVEAERAGKAPIGSSAALHRSDRGRQQRRGDPGGLADHQRRQRLEPPGACPL
jgi:CO dehydrogenase maturation factor